MRWGRAGATDEGRRRRSGGCRRAMRQLSRRCAIDCRVVQMDGGWCAEDFYNRGLFKRVLCGDGVVGEVSTWCVREFQRWVVNYEMKLIAGSLGTAAVK